ncbi:hypothetical protein CCE28_03170 [Anaeromicrobium sediminis]|uniref:Endospore appendages core domain-containing protein n=2 Tax=Anaeromicrobium sediminis TaxID=1478221 RepID=A0A267MLU4_9FIRM|nr:hypothetical protein CCE28_03170 [Anaeromicrobium sediminis]
MGSYCEQSCICCRDKIMDKDCFEQCYSYTGIGPDIPRTLWEADGVVSTSGTLVLEVTELTDGNLDILLNGVSQGLTLDLNDSIVITSDVLNSIVIRPSASNVDVTVDLCLNVSYECC